MKRLTIDIPERLHTRVKSQCAKRGTKMADEIRALLETHFPKAVEQGRGCNPQLQISVFLYFCKYAFKSPKPSTGQGEQSDI